MKHFQSTYPPADCISIMSGSENASTERCNCRVQSWDRGTDDNEEATRATSWLTWNDTRKARVSRVDDIHACSSVAEVGKARFLPFRKIRQATYRHPICIRAWVDERLNKRIVHSRSRTKSKLVLSISMLSRVQRAAWSSGRDRLAGPQQPLYYAI